MHLILKAMIPKTFTLTFCEEIHTLHLFKLPNLLLGKKQKVLDATFCASDKLRQVKSRSEDISEGCLHLIL